MLPSIPLDRRRLEKMRRTCNIVPNMENNRKQWKRWGELVTLHQSLLRQACSSQIFVKVNQNNYKYWDGNAVYCQCLLLLELSTLTHQLIGIKIKTRPLLFKTFEISNAMDSHIVHSLIKTNLPIYKLSVFFSGFVWLMYGRMNLKCNHSCNSTPKSLPGCI